VLRKGAGRGKGWLAAGATRRAKQVPSKPCLRSVQPSAGSVCGQPMLCRGSLGRSREASGSRVQKVEEFEEGACKEPFL